MTNVLVGLKWRMLLSTLLNSWNNWTFCGWTAFDSHADVVFSIILPIFCSTKVDLIVLFQVLQDERERWEAEKQRTVENVKRKQWCSFCTKEALFYCCWNTSYCGDVCQREHWNQHSSQCTQIRQAERQGWKICGWSTQVRVWPFLIILRYSRVRGYLSTHSG